MFAYVPEFQSGDLLVGRVTGDKFRVIEGDDSACGLIAIEPVVFDLWNRYGHVISREQARDSYWNTSRWSGRWRWRLHCFLRFL